MEEQFALMVLIFVILLFAAINKNDSHCRKESEKDESEKDESEEDESEEDEIEKKELELNELFDNSAVDERAFFYGTGESINTSLKKELINERGACCEDCGCIDELMVHHILPVSMGGNNDLQNLKLLCYECHLKNHHHYFEKTGNTGYGEINKKAMFFLDAIMNDLIVTIKYKKTGFMKKSIDITERDIKPLKYYKSEDKYYLKAFCYLRMEERVFRISKIISYKIKQF